MAPRMAKSEPSSENQYELVGEIAHGGMATVFVGRLVRPHGFTRAVAIKRMHGHLAGEGSFRTMFVDEALLVSRIRHPNVVPMLDIVSHDSELLAVMDVVDGAPLAEIAKSYEGPLPPRIAAAIIHDVLCGLHAAHEMRDENGQYLGVIHRDVSPSNILVGSDGLTRIVDFGVAKALGRLKTTMTGMVKGKARYMPPEQLDATENLDRSADVFATSVVLWEMLTGRRLFTSERGFGSGMEARRVVKPSTVSAGAAALDAIVMQGLRKNPRERFGSALEMARAIERAIRPAGRLDVADFVGGLALSSRDRVRRLVREVESNEEHLQCSLATKRTRDAIRSFFPTEFQDLLSDHLPDENAARPSATMTRLLTNRWLQPRLPFRHQLALGLGVVLMCVLVTATARSSEKPIPASAPASFPAPRATTADIPPPPSVFELAAPPRVEERAKNVTEARPPKRRAPARHANKDAVKDVLKDALAHR